MEELQSIGDRLKKIEDFINGKFGDLTPNTLKFRDLLIAMVKESIFNIGKTYYTDIQNRNADGSPTEDSDAEIDFMIHAVGKDTGKLSTDNSQETLNSALYFQHAVSPKIRTLSPDNAAASFYYGIRPPVFQVLKGITVFSIFQELPLPIRLLPSLMLREK